MNYVQYSMEEKRTAFAVWVAKAVGLRFFLKWDGSGLREPIIRGCRLIRG